MHERPFYAPVSSHNATRFQLSVVRDVLVGPPERQFMMGGVDPASAIMTLEQASGRPLIWAAAKYLCFVPPDSISRGTTSQPSCR